MSFRSEIFTATIVFPIIYNEGFAYQTSVVIKSTFYFSRSQSLEAKQKSPLRERDDLVLICSAQGSSETAFSWFKNGFLLNVSRSIRFVQHFLFCLDSLSKWKIILENSSTKSVLWLRWNQKPYDLGKIFENRTMQCEIKSFELWYTDLVGHSVASKSSTHFGIFEGFRIQSTLDVSFTMVKLE